MQPWTDARPATIGSTMAPVGRASSSVLPLRRRADSAKLWRSLSVFVGTDIGISLASRGGPSQAGAPPYCRQSGNVGRICRPRRLHRLSELRRTSRLALTRAAAAYTVNLGSNNPRRRPAPGRRFVVGLLTFSAVRTER